MANPNKLNRRDFMKVGGLSLAVLILAGCAPASQPQPGIPTKESGIWPGEMNKKPFLMANGEPTVMDDQAFITLQGMGLNFPVPENEVPWLSKTTPSSFTAHMFGDYMKVSIPYASGRSGLMIRGPVSYDVAYANQESTAGPFYDKYKRNVSAVVDMTAANQNDVLIYEVAENKGWFFNQNRGGVDIPSPVDENFTVRHSVQALDNLAPRIPGDANFIFTFANFLNQIGTDMTTKLQGQMTTDQIAEAVFNGRTQAMATVFGINPVENLREFYRTLGYNVDDPGINQQVTDYANSLVQTAESYREGLRYVKTPEMAMAVLQSISVLDRMAVNPNDAEEVRQEKLKLLEGYKALVDVDSGLPADEQGVGVWEVDGMEPIDKGKTEFFVSIPQEKPKAIIVQRQQSYVVNNKNGQGTPVPETRYRYKTEVMFLSSTGASIAKSEESDEGVVPNENFFSQELLSRSVPVSNDQMKAEGYQLDSQGWNILSINQLDNNDVRLYHMPDLNNLQWGIEEKDSGYEEAILTGNWSDFSRLFGSGDLYYHQRLILNNAVEFEASPTKWATDVTDKWKQLVSKGNTMATRFGLRSASELMSAVSRGLLLPRDENVKNLLAGLRQQEVIERTRAPYSYGFITTANNETVPVTEIATGNVVGHLENGDMFSYYEPAWVDTAEGRRQYLLIDPDHRYAVPLDVKKFQIINKELGGKAWDYAKSAFPWVLAASIGAQGVEETLGQRLDIFAPAE